MLISVSNSQLSLISSVALFRNQILSYLLWIAVSVRLLLIRLKHLNRVLQLELSLSLKWMATQRVVVLLVRKYDQDNCIVFIGFHINSCKYDVCCGLNPNLMICESN